MSAAERRTTDSETFGNPSHAEKRGGQGRHNRTPPAARRVDEISLLEPHNLRNTSNPYPQSQNRAFFYGYIPKALPVAPMCCHPGDFLRHKAFVPLTTTCHLLSMPAQKCPLYFRKVYGLNCSKPSHQIMTHRRDLSKRFMISPYHSIQIITHYCRLLNVQTTYNRHLFLIPLILYNNAIYCSII